jgi:hypothetical protein
LALGKAFFAERPKKNARQSHRRSANKRIPVVWAGAIGLVGEWWHIMFRLRVGAHRLLGRDGLPLKATAPQDFRYDFIQSATRWTSTTARCDVEQSRKWKPWRIGGLMQVRTRQARPSSQHSLSRSL